VERLLFLFRALGARLISASTAAGTSLHSRLWHPHHLRRHPVGFLLEPVTRLVDGELGLESPVAQQMPDASVPD